MSHPWMKFYSSDWRADPGLRACSIAARGLWMEMLCLMWEADPKGSLLINGKAPSPKLLASLCGVDMKEASPLLAELSENGVFSQDPDGTIYSRRVRRDIERAARDKANGRGGGNPTLTGKRPTGVNPPDNPKVNPPDNLRPHAGVNPTVNGGVKAQKPEARQYPSQVRNVLRDSTNPTELHSPQTATDEEYERDEYYPDMGVAP